MFGTPEGVKNDIYVEANAFCAKQNKAVETVNLQMNNAMTGVRQGSANLTFRCATIGPREFEKCFSNLTSDPELVGLKDKIALNNATDQTFAMLSDNSKPTAKDKELLKVWGSKRDNCFGKRREEMQDARVPLPIVSHSNATATAGQLLIADLVNGNLTYSGYAVKRQELLTFADDVGNKIQAELRKETQDSRHKADQIAIEAQRNDIMRQKVYSDSANTQQLIQSNERINQQKIQSENMRSYIKPTTTTDCVKNGPGIRCTTQ